MHLKPKKRLGQNFLVDKNIQNKIISLLGLKPTDTVLEIGAGRGELTLLIAPRVKLVYALEIDNALSCILKDKFKNQCNVKIINKDILKFNLARYFTKGKLKVVGNIPYYISSPIIEHLIKWRKKIKVIYLTVQKEFAQRIVAPAGAKDYGSLSCYVQYYMQPKILLKIKKGVFFPVPKVDSALLQLITRTKPIVKVEDEREFFKLIRAAFIQRRKMLRNSLKKIVPKDLMEKYFKKYALHRNIRPEELCLEDFANLSSLF